MSCVERENSSASEVIESWGESRTQTERMRAEGELEKLVNSRCQV